MTSLRPGEVRQFLLRSMYRRTRSIDLQRPVVSFCFDDFPRTAYTAGGAILRSLGTRGTYYASLGLMNTTNELGPQLTQDDIESLLIDGHELSSHTYHHWSARRVTLDAFEKDVLHGRDAVRSMTGSDEVDNFAYPYGHVTLASKKRLTVELCSCRGIYPGINGPEIDLNLLRANSLYGDVNELPRVESLLAETARRRGWVIFYTHDVQQNPSPFGCTPALLDSVVALTLERGFQVLPVSQVVRRAVQLLERQVQRGASGETKPSQGHMGGPVDVRDHQGTYFSGHLSAGPSRLGVV
jgi:peptidoglycan/xylan/chitin deacetylase (PgdA/CDA1 family)